MSFSKGKSREGMTVYEGIASSCNLDRDGERLTKSALAKGASDLLKNSTIFFNHKQDWFGLGKIIDAEVLGNYLKIYWTPSKAKAVQDIILQIEEGVLKCMSVGGRIVDYKKEYDEKLKKDIRVITDLEIFETSVVGIGANPDATISQSMSKAFKVGDNVSNEKVEEKPAEVQETPAEEKKEAPAEETKKEEVLKEEAPVENAEKEVTVKIDEKLEKNTEVLVVDAEVKEEASKEEVAPVAEVKVEATPAEEKKEEAPVEGEEKTPEEGGPEETSEKSVKVTEDEKLIKKVDELKAKVEVLEKKAIQPKGLAPAEDSREVKKTLKEGIAGFTGEMLVTSMYHG